MALWSGGHIEHAYWAEAVAGQTESDRLQRAHAGIALIIALASAATKQIQAPSRAAERKVDFQSDGSELRVAYMLNAITEVCGAYVRDGFWSHFNAAGYASD